MTAAPDGVATTTGAQRPLRILFACVGNSARSQMAEALLAAKGGPAFAPASGGIVASSVHPLTVVVLSEVGIDWSGASSKPLAPMLERSWDLVVTVCDEAAEACPVIPPPTAVLHWDFEDPAAATGTEAERLAVFRRVRDEIGASIDDLLADDDARAAIMHSRPTIGASG
ncbi:MAG TPA: arsenate reductase ArsC [Candidatus Limnocylindrales bacterium]